MTYNDTLSHRPDQVQKEAMDLERGNLAHAQTGPTKISPVLPAGRD